MNILEAILESLNRGENPLDNKKLCDRIDRDALTTIDLGGEINHG